jgi:uncharacterized lipoprotein YajG
MRKKLSALPAVVLLAVLVSGCAFTPDYINLQYTPQQNVQAIDAARGIRVEVTVRDVRTQTDRVGAKGVANQAAAIVSREDVKTVVKQAIDAELVQRGYTLGPGNVIIACDLSNFSTTWQVGFWSGSAHGSCQLSVKIKDKNDELVFAEIISGEATEKGIQVTSGENAKIVLDRALQDAMTKLFEMPDFLRSISKASART